MNMTVETKKTRMVTNRKRGFKTVKQIMLNLYQLLRKKSLTSNLSLTMKLHIIGM